MARQSLSAELTIDATLGSGVRNAFRGIDKMLGSTMRGLRGLNAAVEGTGRGGRALAGLTRGVAALGGSFRSTNAMMDQTHSRIRGLTKRYREIERSAKAAAKAGRDTTPWERAIDRLNLKLQKQENQLNRLRVARDRLDRGRAALGGVRDRIAPGIRRAGFVAAGAAVGGALAFGRGFDQFSQFDRELKTLQAEGVAQREIPGIRDQILKFAGETRFTALEISELLVQMKKGGEDINAEMRGFGDLLKFAVAENKDLATTWGVTRTFMKGTNTELRDAVGLMEELSNATSLSRLQIEDYGEIAGKALNIFTGRWRSSAFLSAGGFLADRGTAVETVGITLRQLPLVLSKAVTGGLGGEKQSLFDQLGINIADEQGELKAFTDILGDFNKVFKERGFIGEDNTVTTRGIGFLGGLFDVRYANALGQLITGYQEIGKNMALVEERGRLDEKFRIQSQTISHATAIFKSARDALSLGLFEILNTDNNFVKFFESLTAATNRFKGFIMEHKQPLGEFALFATKALRAVGTFAEGIGKRVFEYFERRGPSVKAFLVNFWNDLRGVWSTMQPVVEFLGRGVLKLFDTLGNFAGGNTGMLAWLAAGAIGWKLLKTPITAVKGSLDLVLGSMAKVRAAWIGLETAGAVAGGGLMPLPAGGTGGRRGRRTPRLGGAADIGIAAGTTAQASRIGRVFKPMIPVVTTLSRAIGTLGRAFASVGRPLAVLGRLSLRGAAGTNLLAAAVFAFVEGSILHIKLIRGNWDKFSLAVSKSWEVVTLVFKGIWHETKALGKNIGTGFGNMIAGMDNKLQDWGINVRGVLDSISGWWDDTFKKMEIGFDHTLNRIIASADRLIGKLEKYQGGKELGGTKVALPLSRVHLANMPEAIRGLPRQELENFASLRRQISIFDKDDKDFAGRAFKVLGEEGGLKTAIAGLDTQKAQALTEFVAAFKALDPQAAGLLEDALFKKTLDPTELERLVGLEKLLPDLTPQAREVITKELHKEGTFAEGVAGLDKVQRDFATAFAANLFALEDKTRDYFTDKVFGDQLKALAELDRREEGTTAGGIGTGIDAVDSPRSSLDFQANPRAPSVEYVDFAGVDEIAQINRAGFDSLLGIADQTLVALQTGMGAQTEAFEKMFESDIPGMEDEDFSHLFEDDTLDIDKPFSFEQPQINLPNIEMPQPREINVPSIANNTTNEHSEGDKVEQVNHFHITQLPGEDASELTDRIMEELAKRSRAGYYE